MIRYSSHLGWMVVLILIMTVAYSIAKYGPDIRSALDPIIEIEPIEVATTIILNEEGKLITRLIFRTKSHKYRPCNLDTWSWKWHFNSISEPAVVRRLRNDEIFRPRTVVAVGEHISDVLYTDLPNVAYGFTRVEFIGVLTFTGPILCRLSPPYQVTIKVDIPAASPVPVPKAEPEI